MESAASTIVKQSDVLGPQFPHLKKLGKRLHNVKGPFQPEHCLILWRESQAIWRNECSFGRSQSHRIAVLRFWAKPWQVTLPKNFLLKRRSCSSSVTFNSLWHHGPCCPGVFLGKTLVFCHFLLQCWNISMETKMQSPALPLTHITVWPWTSHFTSHWERSVPLFKLMDWTWQAVKVFSLALRRGEHNVSYPDGMSFLNFKLLFGLFHLLSLILYFNCITSFEANIKSFYISGRGTLFIIVPTPILFYYHVIIHYNQIPE